MPNNATCGPSPVFLGRRRLEASLPWALAEWEGVPLRRGRGLRGRLRTNLLLAPAPALLLPCCCPAPAPAPSLPPGKRILNRETNYRSSHFLYQYPIISPRKYLSPASYLAIWIHCATLPLQQTLPRPTSVSPAQGHL